MQLDTEGRATRTLERRGLAAVAELGQRCFDEASRLCEDDLEAAIWASASLVRALDRPVRRAEPAPVQAA